MIKDHKVAPPERLEMKDDMESGQGTYTYLDGAKYVGEFKDRLPSGQGTLTYADGTQYVGEFKDGLPNGQGTFTYANGDKYVGEFKDGNFNGKGTFTYADGDYYVGKWEDGKRILKAEKKKEKKKAEQATKELYNSVLNSKWGMKNIPCNYNGGAYTEFILGKGEIFTSGGKKQEGGGISNMSGTLKQISPNQFTMEQILTPTPANRLVYSAIGNRPSAVVFKTYTIINRDLIKFKSEIKMIDVDAILKGYKGNQVGYTYKTEYGERVRCK